MKEIIYIQAGQLANHIGTHFWNAQQSYFTFGEDAEEPIVDHDISFREGISTKGEPTFSPRLLLFDRKSNFGAIAVPYGPEEDAAEEAIEPWEGEVIEYRQDPIPQSQFHSELEAALDANENVKEETTSNKQNKRNVRYWSDYSLVYYHPRSMHRLPDAPEWEDPGGDWSNNGEMFEKFNEEAEFMEGALRMFIEECDNMQGIQVMNDTSTFGCFTNTFITKIRDEFHKLPCLAFPILSPSLPQTLDTDDPHGIQLALNDALTIQGLCELATVAVPLQSPTIWNTADRLAQLNIKQDNSYNTSAITSTIIETATLPLRLKRSADDMSSLTSFLNWRGNTRLAHLSGILPMASDFSFDQDVTKRIFDISSIPSDKKTENDPRMTFARVDICRGFAENVIESYDKWATKFRPLPHCIQAPAINFPSSFPPELSTPPQPVRAMSTLETTSRSACIFGTYGALAKSCLTKHANVIARMGLEEDEVKELRETMFTLEDAYRNDELDGFDSGPDDLGEDEEY